MSTRSNRRTCRNVRGVSSTGMATVTSTQRPRALSPRAYQARLDLCRLYDLMLEGRTQAEIARRMRKHPSWVSRSVSAIQDDLSTVFVSEQGERMIEEHLAQLASLHRQALQLSQTSKGSAKVAALRLALDVLSKKVEYEQDTVLLRSRTEGMMPWGDRLIPMEELQQEIPPASLDKALEMLAEMGVCDKNGSPIQSGGRLPSSGGS